MLNLIRQLWSSYIPDPVMLDHVPVDAVPSNHHRKLKAAAKKYNRPFKCAAKGIPHEVIPSLKAERSSSVITPGAWLAKKGGGK